MKDDLSCSSRLQSSIETSATRAPAQTAARLGNLQLRLLHPRTIIASPLQFESRIGTWRNQHEIISCP